jgi:mono/diheme cytochrome c family protein
MNRFLNGFTGRWAGLLLLVLFFIPIAIASGSREPKPAARLKVDELFNRNCARCHGADGRGDTPSGHLFKAPDFTDTDWWTTNSSTTTTPKLRAAVTRGKAAMPGFGKKLTRSEINLLVDRVRRFRKPERKS